MTKSASSYPVYVLKRIWNGIIPSANTLNKEAAVNDLKDWDMGEDDKEDYEIINNNFQGPGCVDKVFNWHDKNCV